MGELCTYFAKVKYLLNCTDNLHGKYTSTTNIELVTKINKITIQWHSNYGLNSTVKQHRNIVRTKKAYCLHIAKLHSSYTQHIKPVYSAICFMQF